MEELLIKLQDGGIKEIYTDSESYGGCETCDYGSSYINNFTVYMTKGNFQVEIDNMYDYAVSEDYLMKLFIKNLEQIKTLSERNFSVWLKEILEKDYKDQVEKLSIECNLLQ